MFGLTVGILSSITTAAHAVIIKKSLSILKGSTLDLVYFNNLLSAALLAPFVLFSGELTMIRQLVVASWAVDYESDPETDLATHLYFESRQAIYALFIGGFVTGLFGFLINIAGFLQIKVTSPVTHMISSAFRGVAFYAKLRNDEAKAPKKNITDGRRSSNAGFDERTVEEKDDFCIDTKEKQ
ncbi:hypothetical protein HDU76_007576 [Blyttiomyces sp. JEL0837]|nr:hypothetical protein HDU76_007576 [Blyttiomyces sp. JEL0837]